MTCNRTSVTVLTDRKGRTWAFSREGVRSPFSSTWYKYDALPNQYYAQVWDLPFEDVVSRETFLKAMGGVSFFVECRKGAFYE